MGTRETLCGPGEGVMGSLEVKPTLLARVLEATWQNSDVEMHKLVQRARGLHALFHVRSVHGFELVFRGTG